MGLLLFTAACCTSFSGCATSGSVKDTDAPEFILNDGNVELYKEYPSAALTTYAFDRALPGSKWKLRSRTRR